MSAVTSQWAQAGKISMPRRHLDPKKTLSGKLYTENDARFPRQVKYRKVVKSTLCPPGRTEVVFAYIAVEHESVSDFQAVLRRVNTMLKLGECVGSSRQVHLPAVSSRVLPGSASVQHRPRTAGPSISFGYSSSRVQAIRLVSCSNRLVVSSMRHRRWVVDIGRPIIRWASQSLR